MGKYEATKNHVWIRVSWGRDNIHEMLGENGNLTYINVNLWNDPTSIIDICICVNICKHIHIDLGIYICVYTPHTVVLKQGKSFKSLYKK